MNSEQIKEYLTTIAFDGCQTTRTAVFQYILALEAERDAGREMRKTRKVGRADRQAAYQAAMDRVDSFKPPAAAGEGEKA